MIVAADPGAAFADPPFYVVGQPYLALGEIGDRVREVVTVGDLVYALAGLSAAQQRADPLCADKTDRLRCHARDYSHATMKNATGVLSLRRIGRLTIRGPRFGAWPVEAWRETVSLPTMFDDAKLHIVEHRCPARANSPAAPGQPGKSAMPAVRSIGRV
jgi:hypothetical protein